VAIDIGLKRLGQAHQSARIDQLPHRGDSPCIRILADGVRMQSTSFTCFSELHIVHMSDCEVNFHYLSTPNLRHLPVDGNDVLVQAMTPGLIPYPGSDDVLEVILSSSLAQRRQQIDFFFTQQT
jgi:hypothetical protein